MSGLYASRIIIIIIKKPLFPAERYTNTNLTITWRQTRMCTLAKEKLYRAKQLPTLETGIIYSIANAYTLTHTTIENTDNNNKYSRVADPNNSKQPLHVEENNSFNLFHSAQLKSSEFIIYNNFLIVQKKKYTLFSYVLSWCLSWISLILFNIKSWKIWSMFDAMFHWCIVSHVRWGTGHSWLSFRLS